MVGCDRAYVALRRQQGLCRLLSPEAGCAFAASVFALLYRGTCTSSLVRSHTSRSPGARHLRACPVREVSLPSSDRVRVGRRRRGGSLGPRC
ncbi:hypothetical protein Taro_003297 [Colocasia esculenta]|uniref:Uncharacterized protein n=1 Tax=Colocasia esculenta TaxID=4460 RepID=A0A843TRD5_COLES|nr:hypothetical protein [Colocasia esculenta]